MIYIDDEWQPSSLKPGKNTAADVDHPGTIDVTRSPQIWDALDRAKIDAQRHMMMMPF